MKKFFKDVEYFVLPTISLEALFISFVIDAHKGRYINTFDIPGEYIHAEIPEDKQILFKL